MVKRDKEIYDDSSLGDLGQRALSRYYLSRSLIPE